MAVIPSLAVMAGLTLLFNPGAQPEGTEIDYTPMRPFAVRLQRAWRRTRAGKLIGRVLRGHMVRRIAPRWPDVLGWRPRFNQRQVRFLEARNDYHLMYWETPGPRLTTGLFGL